MRKIDIEAFKIADYIIENKATIRKTATYFGVSKTFVATKLKEISKFQLIKVKEILDENNKNKYRNGGLTAQKKIKEMKEKLKTYESKKELN